ncbi:MAG TPA: ATP-binding cassette domain-containing protein [Conexibacter sp.]|jgi:putative ABC transport system ATP-binding protein|nr:ATP-binding cassette domain-containing protein [Conexibacter sp.]
MTLLSLDGVTKRYARGYREVEALASIDLDVEAGDFVAIWGGSRSGKTTLLRAAAGIETPDGGRVAFDGVDLAALSRHARARLLLTDIGCVWQTGRITRGLSVLDHVALPRFKQRSHAQARGEAHDVLERVGAPQVASARWHELTDGERTRVALAHALIRQPRLLLADEPTANLNMIEREQVLSVLRSVADEAGVAIVMTAPDAPNLLQSHRMMSLDDGRLIKPRSEQRGTLIDFPRVSERTSRGG